MSNEEQKAPKNVLLHKFSIEDALNGNSGFNTYEKIEALKPSKVERDFEKVIRAVPFQKLIKERKKIP